MKYLEGKVQRDKFDWSNKAWKRRVLIFGIINLVSFIFLPSVFYGAWGTASSIVQSMAENRKVYSIRKRHGRSVADLYESVNVWKSLPKAINPINWGK